MAVLTQAQRSNCDSGNVQCCETVMTRDHYSQYASHGGLIAELLQDVEGMVGVNCNTVSVIGVGGNDCSQQPVCCTDVRENGLVALGCTPVNVNV
ncbi:fungal hydrophobin [Schizopora paradoxa]|uniref:Hydrophobin n=1 Tax=Schizopora paradoxa TaxID=27342 RepID=A0A0H2S8R5_9AGAM|nr:fungal hydrophobin [Schizopora paradoxa]